MLELPCSYGASADGNGLCWQRAAPRQQQAAAEGVLQQAREVVQLYRTPGLSRSAAETLLRRAQQKVSADITGIESELVRHAAASMLGACMHAEPAKHLGVKVAMTCMRSKSGRGLGHHLQHPCTAPVGGAPANACMCVSDAVLQRDAGGAAVRGAGGDADVAAARDL